VVTDRTRRAEKLDLWRPTAGLGTWLIGTLAMQAIGYVLLAAIDDGTAWVKLHHALSVDGGQASTRELEHALDKVQPWTSVVGWVSIGVLVLSIVWTYRSTVNARAAGVTGLRWSPGWTIAGWLVPFLNFVVPYQVWSDLWRSSQLDAGPDEAWRRRPASPLLIAWWFLMMGGQITFAVTVAFVVSGDLGASDARPLLVGSRLAVAVGSLLGVLVVRAITIRQALRQGLDPAPIPQASAVRAAGSAGPLDAPGWYPDPGGRYEYRYWDGATWTEHVSRYGMSSTAPVVPADWYPDPTGRFHWRYWTGEEWTEHVSRDQELFVDPLSGDPGDVGGPPGGPPRGS
jgi:hypothetical protein